MKRIEQAVGGWVLAAVAVLILVLASPRLECTVRVNSRVNSRPTTAPAGN